MWLLAALLAWPAGAAPPRPAPTDRAALQAEMDAAAARFKAGEYEAALARLRAVDAQVAVPVVRYNIARCLEALDRPREAVFAYERYLRLQDEPARKERARAALARLERRAFGELVVTCLPAGAAVDLKIEGLTTEPVPCPWRKVRVAPGRYTVVVHSPDFAPFGAQIEVVAGETARLEARLKPQSGTFVVRSTVPGGEVYLGDVLVGPVSGGETALPAGTYTLVVRTPGHQDVRRTVTIVPDRREAVEVAPEPLPPASAPVAARAPEPPRAMPAPAPAVEAEASVWERPLPVALGAGAAASLAAGAVFYLKARDDLDALDAARARYRSAMDGATARAAYAEQRAAADDAEAHRWLAYGLLGAGVALGAATGTLLWLDDDTRVGAGPTEAGGAAVTWAGRF